MVTIPSSLAPRIYPGGAITEAQRQDVEQYGSLQGAQEARYQASVAEYNRQAAEQQAMINAREKELQDQIAANQVVGQRIMYSKKSLAKMQAAVNAASAELAQLQQLKSSYQPGTVYGNVSETLSSLKSYGQQVQSYEYERASQPRTPSRPALPEGSFYSADKKYLFDKSGQIIWADTTAASSSKTQVPGTFWSSDKSTLFDSKGNIIYSTKWQVDKPTQTQTTNIVLEDAQGKPIYPGNIQGVTKIPLYYELGVVPKEGGGFRPIAQGGKVYTSPIPSKQTEIQIPSQGIQYLGQQPQRQPTVLAPGQAGYVPLEQINQPGPATIYGRQGEQFVPASQAQVTIYPGQQPYRLPPGTKTFQQGPGSYNPVSGMYITPSETGMSATGILRPETDYEKFVRIENEKKGMAVVRTVTGYPLGIGLLTSEYNRDLAYKGQKLSTLFSPKYQYELAKYQEDLRYARRQVAEEMKRYEQAAKDYRMGVIDVNEYNAIVKSIISSPAYQFATNKQKTTVSQAIAGSELSPVGRFAAQAGVSTYLIGSYFVPGANIAMGLNTAVLGAREFAEAKTTKEKVIYGVQTGLGAYAAYSGINSIFGLTSPSTMGWTREEYLGFRRLGTVSAFAIGESLGALNVASTLKETGDVPTALGAGVGTALGVIIPNVVQYIPVEAKFEAIKTSVRREYGELTGFRGNRAQRLSNEGGVVSGSTDIEVMIGKGARKPNDMDVNFYVKNREQAQLAQAKLGTIAQRELQYEIERYIRNGMDPSGLGIEVRSNGMQYKIVDSISKKTFLDLNIKVGTSNAILVDGINYRPLKDIIRDKEGIVRRSTDVEKVVKAKEDLSVINKALESPVSKATGIPTTEKYVAGGFFLQGKPFTKFEGKVFPVVTVNRDLQFGFGGFSSISKTGTPQTFSILSQTIRPSRTATNVELYPDTPVSNLFYSQPGVKRAVGVSYNAQAANKEITAVISKATKLAVKEDLDKLTESAKTAKFSKETKLLDTLETKATKEFFQKYKSDFERLYGSYTEQPQNIAEMRRLSGDIEAATKARGDALNLAQKYVNWMNERGLVGFEVKDSATSGISILKNGEKAIEIKYPGDPTASTSTSGYRYGLYENRFATKIEGIRSQTSGEQLVRKIGSSASWFQGEDGKLLIGPALNREKDVFDAYRNFKTREFDAISRGQTDVAKEWSKIASDWKAAHIKQLPDLKAGFEEIPTEAAKYAQAQLIDAESLRYPNQNLMDVKAALVNPFGTLGAGVSMKYNALYSGTAPSTVRETVGLKPKGEVSPNIFDFTGKVESVRSGTKIPTSREIFGFGPATRVPSLSKTPTTKIVSTTQQVSEQFSASITPTSLFSFSAIPVSPTYSRISVSPSMISVSPSVSTYSTSPSPYSVSPSPYSISPSPSSYSVSPSPSPSPYSLSPSPSPSPSPYSVSPSPYSVSPSPSSPPSQVPGVPGLFGLDWPGETPKKKEEPLAAYQGYVLQRKKYVKVTQAPMTREAALDVVARVVDNTTAGQGKVEPITEKKKQGSLIVEVIKQFAPQDVQEGDGYFKSNKKKFREFKLYGGQKIPMKDTIIENKGYRSDTPGEKRGLVFGQFQARSYKRSVGLPVRRNKGRRTPFGF